MSRAESPDHVVCKGATFVCRHCGGEYRVPLAWRLDDLVAAMESWGARHTDCAPEDEPEGEP